MVQTTAPKNTILKGGWCPKCKQDIDLLAMYKPGPPRWDVSCPKCGLLKHDLLCCGPDDVPSWGVVLISEEPLTEYELRHAQELIEKHGWDVGLEPAEA